MASVISIAFPGVAWHMEAGGAHLDVETVVNLDHLAEYADPLVQICEVERVPQLVDQGFLLAFVCRCDVGLAQRPLS
jgi:hypothetical protein